MVAVKVNFDFIILVTSILRIPFYHVSCFSNKDFMSSRYLLLYHWFHKHQPLWWWNWDITNRYMWIPCMAADARPLYIASPGHQQAGYQVKGSLFSTRKDLKYLHHLRFNTLRTRQNGRHFQTTLWNAFSWMKICEFRLRFHWCLFLRV